MFGRVAIVPMGTVGGVEAELLELNAEQPASSAAATTMQAARAPRDQREDAPVVSGSASPTFSGTLVDSPRAARNAIRPDAPVRRAQVAPESPGPLLAQSVIS